MAEGRNTNDRATRNRAIRHEALREQLQADQLIRQTLARIEKLDQGVKDSTEVQAIKAANDASLRLLAKVLPDLKAVDHTGDISATVGFTSVDPSRLSTATLRELIAQREVSSDVPGDPG